MVPVAPESDGGRAVGPGGEFGKSGEPGHDRVEVIVGRIGKPHGVRGEVAVEVRTDVPAERYADGASLRTRPAEVGPLRVTSTRWHGGRLLVRFNGVADRDAAERLRGILLLVDADRTDDTGDPDEFYDHQLVGLAVGTADGTSVGTVIEVVHLPGQELLAVRRLDGAEALVPFVAAIVTAVDLAAGRVLIEPPAGLLAEVEDDITEAGGDTDGGDAGTAGADPNAGTES